MNTTLTTQQRETLCETYNKEVFNGLNNECYATAMAFKAMRPKTHRKLLKKVCNAFKVSSPDVVDTLEQEWQDFVSEWYKPAEFWEQFVSLIFDYSEIYLYNDHEASKTLAKRCDSAD